MKINNLEENSWEKGDYRSALALDLDIDYFENILQRKAIDYWEDGLGPAKCLMCKCEGEQFLIKWYEYDETQYRTSLELQYPFKNKRKFVNLVINELQVPNNKICWLNEEI